MTTTKTNTLQEELELANPNTIADALKAAGLARQLASIKATFVGLASASAHDVTTAASRAAATVVGAVLETTEVLPPISPGCEVRVTAGAAAAGPRQITDAGGTASATVAKLSDDGKTLTFEAGVTAFVLVYRPASVNALDTSSFSNEI